VSVPTILETIVTVKEREVATRKNLCSLDQIKSMLPENRCRGFVQSLQGKAQLTGSGVIAEIKRASPSKGIIRTNFNPAKIAMQYQRAGAACLSVLTDSEFFKGSDDFLRQVSNESTLPVLRKDFVIDEYQIYEARVLGADCILLIVAILDEFQLSRFFHIATEIGLDVLIEVHNEDELQQALKVSPRLIGINNRNLHNFDTSLDTTLRLLSMIPDDCFVVTESGIASAADVGVMHDHGVMGFLVGEAFMREEDPGSALKNLFYSS